MDTRSHNVLVNAAGCLYAFLGFSLSVLTALFSLFQRRNPPSKVPLPAQLLPTKPNLPSDARGRRIVRSFSDQSVRAPAPTPTPLAKLRESSTGEKRKIISSHRRSRSLIPIIKIDHFDNIETPRQLSAGLLEREPRISESINPLPKPQRFTICPDDSLANSSTGNTDVGVGDRLAFRLFNPKSWGKDRPKVERRCSSPELCQPPLLPPTKSPASHKQSDSDGKLKGCLSSKGETKPTTRKVIRKAKSSYNLNVREKANVNAEPPPPVPRNVEKKRSQTLRTQPYEAPYFCTPPMPMPIRKSPRSNLRSPPPPLPSQSLDRKVNS